MHNNRRLINLTLLLFLISCVSQKSSILQNNDRGYYEDLSYIRFQEKRKNKDTEDVKLINNADKNDLNLELDSIIKIIISDKETNKFIDGFTIQIYLGGDRETAEEIESQINEIDSLISSNTVFTQPNYRVKIGKYLNRFKANQEYKKYKFLFPNAMIIPEKIKIN